MPASLGKKLILIVSVSLFLGTFATAITWSVEWKPWGVRDYQRSEYEQAVASRVTRRTLLERYKSEARPKFVSSKSFFDLGLVQPDEFIRTELKISNDGELPLELILSRNSVCGLSLKLWDPVVAPGGQTKVTLSGPSEQLRLSDIESAEKKDKSLSDRDTVMIRSNDPLNQERRFLIKGRIAREIVAPEVVALSPADPGVERSVSFTVYSETSEHLSIKATRLMSGKEVAWFFTEDKESLKAAPPTARAAGTVTLVYTNFKYGSFSEQIRLFAEVGSEERTIELELTGKVRSAIKFVSEKFDIRKGLEMGTIQSNEECNEYVGVVMRGNEWRKLKVLDFVPQVLDVTLRELKSAGRYQLAITIPKGCPSVTFNRPDHHGYIKIGDPEDPSFSDWFPIYGAIVDAGK